MPNVDNDDGGEQRRTTSPRRQPTVQIKRSHPPRLASLGNEVDLEDVVASEVADFTNVTFAGDLSIQLIREERNAYDRRLTAISTLYERTLPEQNRKGASIAWVQHAKTGELVPLVIGGGAEADQAEQDDADNKNAADPARQPLLLPPPLTAAAHDVESGQAYANSAMAAAQFDEATHSFDDTVVLIRSAFLFAQGLLAGFGFTTISTETAAAANDADFLIGYQPNAMQYRRLFYLLSTISVVGSIDTFMSITSKVSREVMRKKKPSAAALGATGKPADVPLDTGGFFVSFCRALGSAQEGTNVAVAVVLMILHAIAFLCTVIMSQVDTIVAVRGGYGPGVPETTWVVALLNAPGFSGLLRTWKNSDQVRLVASVLAWLLCCFLSWRNLSAVEAKNTEIKRLKDALGEWQQRVDLFEGNDGLEELSTTALKRLVSLQQLGVERAQTALKSLTEASRA